ncbi:hypothetical protein OH77DRAFT_1415579 [Trametes cingulata]|nr:hypothetical protein OH77DRAFT_1415579 [Trametes cingulata]
MTPRVPTTTTTTHATASSTTSATTSSPTPTSDRRDGSGVTFGGAGQPMDIDTARRRGACFACGQRGHIQRDCPNRKVVVRNLVQQLSAEDRAELLKELGTVGDLTVEGFHEGRE